MKGHCTSLLEAGGRSKEALRPRVSSLSLSLLARLDVGIGAAASVEASAPKSASSKDDPPMPPPLEPPLDPQWMAPPPGASPPSPLASPFAPPPPVTPKCPTAEAGCQTILDAGPRQEDDAAVDASALPPPPKKRNVRAVSAAPPSRLPAFASLLRSDDMYHN